MSASKPQSEPLLRLHDLLSTPVEGEGVVILSEDECLDALDDLNSLKEQVEALQTKLDERGKGLPIRWDGERIAQLKREKEELQEQLEAARINRSEWREGMVSVYDYEGNCVGSMGQETWAWMLSVAVRSATYS